MENRTKIWQLRQNWQLVRRKKVSSTTFDKFGISQKKIFARKTSQFVFFRSYNKINKNATTISRSDYVAFNPKPSNKGGWKKIILIQIFKTLRSAGWPQRGNRGFQSNFFISITVICTRIWVSYKIWNEGFDLNSIWRHSNLEILGLISGYDQEYNRKQPKRALRKWDQHKIKWAPERTDFPMRGKGLKFLVFK